jgi:hypothetical protein
LPQAHLTVAVAYTGWISGFIFNLSLIGSNVAMNYSQIGPVKQVKGGSTAARAGHSLALASSGYRDGSLIRMKRIFRIYRILLKL